MTTLDAVKGLVMSLLQTGNLFGVSGRLSHAVKGELAEREFYRKDAEKVLLPSSSPGLVV